MSLNLKQFDLVRARIKMRNEYNGRPLKAGLIGADGLELTLCAAWMMDDKVDQYPGEFAMVETDGDQLWKRCQIAWIAQGDLEILEVIKAAPREEWVELDKPNDYYYKNWEDTLPGPSFLRFNDGSTAVIGDMNMKSGACSCCAYTQDKEVVAYKWLGEAWKP